MNSFVVELPAELQAEVARRASQKASGESAWVAEAVREKLAACAQLEYLENRPVRGNRQGYERVLAKVPPAPPVPGDERSPSGLTNGSS
jgi:hypothetical protein